MIYQRCFPKQTKKTREHTEREEIDCEKKWGESRDGVERWTRVESACEREREREIERGKKNEHIQNSMPTSA
jgi:hypothetical protein